MGLPNIGPLELIIILAIALLIVGPRRLPEMGNAVGRTIREFRKASTEVSEATTITPEPKATAPAQLPSQAQGVVSASPGDGSISADSQAASAAPGETMAAGVPGAATAPGEISAAGTPSAAAEQVTTADSDDATKLA